VNYVYTFDDLALERLSGLFESRIGESDGDSEQDFWDMLKLLLYLKSNGVLLDIGAGVGRVTAVAKGIVRETIALEPDRSRWRMCHQYCHQYPQCEVLCQTTTEYHNEHARKKFDLIIVSMVLQHLATNDCDKLLEEVAALLKPDGITLICTTHTLEEAKGFSFSGETEKYVSEQVFNDYAHSPAANKTKGIPVRRFSKSELLDQVARHLDQIYWRQCAYLNENGIKFYAPMLKVDPQKLRNVGRSQFVVARKRH
jgi:cyclopropane fatty-acyl-phospholipid synthase-like methyltransferase